MPSDKTAKPPIYRIEDLESGKAVVHTSRSSTGRWSLIRTRVAQLLAKSGEAVPVAFVVREMAKLDSFKGEEYRLVYTMTRNALKKYKGFHLQRIGSAAFIVKE